MQIDDLLIVISRQHGLNLTLGERFLRGEQGAFAVTDASGAPFVLKWSSADAHERLLRARRVTEHLRSKGYPAPRFVLDGIVDNVAYCLQEELPGLPMLPVNPVYLSHLLALNDLQRCPGPLPAGGWPEWLVETVFVGAGGYCEPASLEGHSQETRELLRQVQSYVVRDAEIACPDHDIVHFDFNPGNILIADGQVSGVVDWDGATAGDRMFDVVTLLYYTRTDPEARQLLWDYLREYSTFPAVALYLGHIIIRQLDWSIRYHDADSVRLWTDNAWNLLGELIPGMRP